MGATGLTEALIKQEKKKIEMEVQRQTKTALARSDVQITSSVF